MLYIEHTNESLKQRKKNNSVISMLYIEHTNEAIVTFCLKHGITVKSGSVAYRARKY